MHIQRVLLTGCNGFIGSNLALRCKEEGWTVHGVDNLSSGHKEFLPEREIDRVFYSDFAGKVVENSINKHSYDVVFHLAAVPRVSYSVEHPLESNDTNVSKTLKLMESCKGKIGRFVFSSSSSVYGGADVLPTPETHPKSPKSPYALQKSIIEDYLKIYDDLYEFESVCLRYFNVFGKNSLGGSAYCTAIGAWLSAMVNGQPLRSDGDGSQSRDLCYVDNVTYANVLAAKCDKKLHADVFNVACGDRTSNKEILEFLKEKNKDIHVIDAPWRPGDVLHTQADITKARDVLGYTDVVRVWDGLERTYEWAMTSPLMKTLRSKF
jgi:UDP-N-acetylglucosamine 4-epimerase